MPPTRPEVFDASKPIFGKALISNPTPVVEDIIVSMDVIVDPTSYDQLPLFTAKEDNDRTGLGLFLIWQSGVHVRDDKTYVRRVYANRRVHQDVYNYSTKYSLEDYSYPIFTRSYVIRRDEFTATARGTRKSGVLYAILNSGGTGYSSRLDKVPVITVTGGGGSGCQVTCQVYNGAICAFYILAEGTGYTSAPTFTITDPLGVGTGASGTAFVQPAANILVSQEQLRIQEDQQLDGAYVRIVEVYEQIPGPTVTSYRYGEQGELITTTTQKVLAGTTPNADGLLVENSAVQGADTVFANKVYEVADAWPLLTGKEEVAEAGRQLHKFTACKEKTMTSQEVDPSASAPAPGFLVIASLKQFLTKTKSRITETAVAAFDTLTSKGILHEALGEFATTTETVVAAGTAPDAGGLLVIDSSTEAVDGQRSIKKTVTVPSFPTVTGSEYDSKTGNMITIEKTFVAAGTLGSHSDGVITEITPYDKWRSIQIKSTLNLVTTTRSFPVQFHYSFPNQLNNAVYSSAWATSSTDDVIVRRAFDIGLNLDVEEGYSGPCDGTLHEVYTYDPSTVTIPEVTTFHPQGHMVTLTDWFANEHVTQANVRAFHIPSCLHGELTIDGSTVGPTSPPTPGVPTIPATVPAALPTSGTLLTVHIAEPERYHFGLYIVRWIEIKAP